MVKTSDCGSLNRVRVPPSPHILLKYVYPPQFIARLSQLGLPEHINRLILKERKSLFINAIVKMT